MGAGPRARHTAIQPPPDPDTDPMPDPATIDPIALLRPRRAIAGASAILLPFDAAGAVDWPSFEAHVDRTARHGLTPAVNMDTGYVNLIDAGTQDEVIARTRAVLGGGPFYAGAFVRDASGDTFDRDRYLYQAEPIVAAGGVPVIVPSHGLTRLDDDVVVIAHEQLARQLDRFVAFELGREFSPAGRIYGLDAFRGLMAIPRCVGIKHSSLRREPEWRRLVERDRLRPDFRVFTGNDLAVDMVMYGSDYLLGLSTFAPDLFARRDALWAAGDRAFYELNDKLQYLGAFTFRAPVPAYKHSAAMFLHLRGWIGTDRTHPGSPTRPDSDRDVLRTILASLELPEHGG